MKWIRYFGLGLSVAALALSMAACGDKQTASSETGGEETLPAAYTLYTQTFEKSMAEERLAYSAEMNMGIQMASVSAESTITMNFAQILSGNDPRIQMDQLTDMRMTAQPVAEEGQEEPAQGTEEQQKVEQTIYYADGMWYESMGDEKFRQKLELAQAEDLVSKNSGLMEIPENAFQDAVVTGTKEVGYTVTATLSAAVIRQELLQQLTAFPAQFQERFETMLDSLVFTNPSFQFTVDADGYLSSYTLAYDVSLDTGEVDEEGESIIVQMSLEAAIANFQYGKQVRVVEPDNLDTYPEPARQLTEEEQQEIVDALTNDDGSPVENFNEVYRQLVEKYGQSTMKAFFSEE